MFQISMVEGQDYGGFLYSHSCHLGAAYLCFDGMLQNIWDARLLTGGVNTQTEPMSTAPNVINPSNPFLPTPDTPCSSYSLGTSLSALFPLSPSVQSDGVRRKF